MQSRLRVYFRVMTGGKAANRSALDEMIQRSKQDMRLFIIKVVKVRRKATCHVKGNSGSVLINAVYME